jgi:uncharacterized membrane protein YfcA
MNPALLGGFVGVGLVVGFTAGLVGIGGGVLMVPFLYFVYEGWGASFGWTVAPELEAAVSHATSLFVIVPTAIVGVLAYSRKRLVEWRAALPIAAFSIPGGILGARVAILLPADLLKVAFGLFLLASAIQLVAGKRTASERPLRISAWVTIPTGLGVGVFSALMGVGGGLVAIPMLIHLIGMPVQKVAATSLAVIIFAASAGTITYIAEGWTAPGLPPGSLGYVHALAALPLMIGSVLTVQAGARLNQSMDVRLLRRLFAALLLVLGGRLVVQGIAGLL